MPLPFHKTQFILTACLLAVAGMLSANDQGKALYVTCVACHGDKGQGNPMFKSPQLAGLPQYYLENQLKKFKEGIRGAHPDAVTGMQMRPMSMTLADDNAIKAVSEYIRTFSPVSQEPTLTGGDAEKGKAFYATCVACHGDKGQGNEALKSPSLQHLQDWYMLAQLQKFKKGIRGANPKDIEGAQMRPMAMMLTDEQAMKDVIAHIQELSKQ